MAELADATDLKSVEGKPHGGSSPPGAIRKGYNMIDDHLDLIKKISYSLKNKCSRWNDDEIYSAALVNAWKRLAKFDPEKTTVEKYLSFTVTKDTIYDYMRDMGYKKQTDSTWKMRHNLITNSNALFEDKTCTSTDTEVDLSGLSARQIELIDLKLNGLTQEQIGNVMDRSKAWVCIELKKIKEVLKEN